MPEDLGELMGRASDEPVAPLDADAVWKRGTRKRMARRAALSLPILVLVAVVGGLLVMASDNDGGSGTDDSLFAGLTAEEQTVVDEYLRVLEAEGALAGFPDERAAVEYAWRVECFGAITPAELNALGAAVTDLVGALSAEAVASVAFMEGVIDEAAVDDVRTVTDDAIEAYHEVSDRLGADRTSATTAYDNAREEVATRLQSQDVIRQAIDGQQLDPINAAIQLSESADSALALLSEAASLSEDGALVRGWDAHRYLLQAARSAAESAALTVDMLRPPSSAEEADFFDAVSEEDQALTLFSERVSGALKSELRRATATEEGFAYQQIVDDLVLVLSSGSTPVGSVEEADRAYQLASEVRLPAYRQVADASVAEIVAATEDSSDPARDAAVAAACDATGDAVLAIDPAILDSGD